MKAWDINFYDKISQFLRGYKFKLFGKNWIEGVQGPCMVVNFVANNRCKRKMLKETETEKQ